jgi:hypothetical protein
MVSVSAVNRSGTSSRLVLTLANTEDVLKARLKTIGVSEHKFTIEIGQPFHRPVNDLTELVSLILSSLISSR